MTEKNGEVIWTKQKKYHEAVKSSLPEVRSKLERLSEDVSKALEKIGKKEQVLTRSFQG